MARRPDGSYVDDDDYYGATNATYGPPPERFESKVEISVRELTALRAEIAAAQEAARVALAGQVALTLEVERLRALVHKAVLLGFALEERYGDAQKAQHNYQWWDDEQWDPIQAARNALGAVLKESDTP